MPNDSSVKIIGDLYSIIQNNDLLYGTFAIVAPIVIFYKLFPGELPEATFYSIFFVIFYVLIFQIIYRIYFNEKIKIDEKIRINIAPIAIENNNKMKQLNTELIRSKNDSKIPKMFLNSWINKSNKFIDQVERAEHNIKLINKHGKELHEKMDYKHYQKFDYILMFSAVTIYLINFFLDSNITSYSLIILFFIIVILYTFIELIKYKKIQIYIKIYEIALPKGLLFMESQNKRI